MQSIYICGQCYNNHRISPTINFKPFTLKNNKIPLFFCPVHGKIKSIHGYFYILPLETIKKDEILWRYTMSDALENMQELEVPYVKVTDGYYRTLHTDRLSAAKIKAQQSMDEKAALDKDNQRKYKYTSFNQFIIHVRKHLLDNGLTFTPITDSVTWSEENNGTVVINWFWKLEHSESGQWEMFLIPSMSNNKDKGDKHLSKAVSYNIKDALRTVFLIPSGDDDDPDNDDSKVDLRKQNEALTVRLKDAADKLNKVFSILTDEQKASLKAG